MEMFIFCIFFLKKKLLCCFVRKMNLIQEKRDEHACKGLWMKKLLEKCDCLALNTKYLRTVSFVLRAHTHAHIPWGIHNILYSGSSLLIQYHHWFKREQIYKIAILLSTANDVIRDCYFSLCSSSFVLFFKIKKTWFRNSIYTYFCYLIESLIEKKWKQNKKQCAVIQRCWFHKDKQEKKKEKKQRRKKNYDYEITSLVKEIIYFFCSFSF